MKKPGGLCPAASFGLEFLIWDPVLDVFTAPLYARASPSTGPIGKAREKLEHHPGGSAGR